MRTFLKIAGGIAVIIIGLAIFGSFLPADKSTNKPTATSTGTTNPAPNDSADASPPSSPASCDDADTTDAVKGAIEESPASKLISIKVVDFGNAHELYFDKNSNTRFCQADVLLNSGAEKLSYRVFFGPSGGQAVEEQIGEDAYNTRGMIAANQTSSMPTRTSSDQQPSPQSQTPTNSSDTNSANTTAAPDNSNLSFAQASMDDPKARKISKCLLVVDGKSYIDGPCVFVPSTGGGFSIIGYNNWFAVVNVADGVASGSWNNDGGQPASHAQDELGSLVRSGACFVGPKARVCARA
jgi:hypothetical protein